MSGSILSADETEILQERVLKLEQRVYLLEKALYGEIELPKKMVKKETLSKQKQSKWYVGTGIVYGENGLLNHQRIDLYFLNSNYPRWTCKIGYAKQDIPLPGQDDEGVEWAFVPTSESVLFGVGYNLISIGNFFIDGGLVYNYVISDTDYDGKIYNRFSNGAYWRATKLRTKSTPGYEVGLGYSIGQFSIRIDFTTLVQPQELEGQYYDTNNIPQETEKDSGSVDFLTIGLTYWW